MENAVKKREANLELLRIIAMFMVIALHYFGKGQALSALEDPSYNYNSTLSYIFESLCYPATNLYVLISGYFLVKSSFKAEKLVKLWIQVLFYSLGIFLICYLLKIANPADYADIYGKAHFVFPVFTKHYWFASVYIVFYLFSPFLAKLVCSLSKTQLLTLIIIACCIYSTLFTTFIVFAYDWHDHGMGIIWFTILFLIAGYIRLYGKEEVNSIKDISIYMIASFFTFLLMLLFGYIYNLTGKGSGNIYLFYNYNSPTVLIASAALFNVYRGLKIKEGILSKIILFVSPLTFGIYLVHEHICLRGLWVSLWKVPQMHDNPLFILHFVCIVTLVFVICGLIELLRKTVFDFIYKIPFIKKFFELTNKVNKYFN